MKKLSTLEKYKLILPIIACEITCLEQGKEHGIPARTLRHWVKQFNSKGLIGLERKHRSDKGNYRCVNNDLVDLATGLALQKPPLLISAIHRKIAIIAKRWSIEIPSYDTVYNIVKRINPRLLTLAIDGSKVYQQKYELIYRRECKYPNEIWQADHTEMDIYILDDKGNERKPWLTTVIDDYSRAIAGRFLSFDAPSSLNTALALKQAIWKKKNPQWEICGIPSILYTDHGTDFMSIHIQQVCINLKIRMINSIIGRPQGRGKIERFFQTLNECVLIDQPGFSINGKSYSKASLSIEELDVLLEKFIVEKYHLDTHSTTGQAPIKMWSFNFLPCLPESISVLDELLLTIDKPRKIQRDGIRFMGFRYIATTLAGFVGESVFIKYDPRDLAEIKVYYNNAFLCKAICQDLAELTISLKEIKKARKDVKRKLYKEIKTYKRVVDEKSKEVVIISSNKTIKKVANLNTPCKKSKIKLYENE